MKRLVLVLALVACKGKPEDKTAPHPADRAAAGQKDPLAMFDLPEVGDGFEPVTGDAPLAVVVSPTEIVVDGKSIVPLDKGVARPEDREGGAMGLKIPRLSTMLAAHADLAKKSPQSPQTYSLDKPPALTLVVAQSVPYRTLIEVMYSAKQKEAGYRAFHILARSKGRYVQAPIVLPDKSAGGTQLNEDEATAFAEMLTEGTPAQGGTDLGKEIELGGKARPGADLGKQIDEAKAKTAGSAAKPAAPPTPARAPEDMPVRLVVALTKDKTILWSMSGLEGTLQAPKLDLPYGATLAQLKTTLEQIAQNRWAGKKEREQTIVLMADPDVPMRRITGVMAAVRPVFPDIQLASGFE